MKKVKLIVIAVTALSIYLGPLQGKDDFQTWQEFLLKVHDSPRLDMYLFGQTRIGEDSTRRQLALISPKLHYAVNSNLTLAVNYTYLDIKTPACAYTTSQHWLEFEANPKLRLFEKLGFTNRNRMEIRWIEDDDRVHYWTRHQISFSRALENFGPFKRAFLSEEIFYDYTRNKIAENRFIPLRLRMNLKGRTEMDFYAMVQSTCNSSDSWNHRYVLGIGLRTAILRKGR